MPRAQPAAAPVAPRVQKRWYALFEYPTESRSIIATRTSIEYGVLRSMYVDVCTSVAVFTACCSCSCFCCCCCCFATAAVNLCSLSIAVGAARHVLQSRGLIIRRSHTTSPSTPSASIGRGIWWYPAWNLILLCTADVIWR